MHIYEACPEVENESVLLYIPHINDRLPGRARSQAVTNLMCVRFCPDPLGVVLWCAVGRGTRQGLPCVKGAVAKRLRDCAAQIFDFDDRWAKWGRR